MEIIRSSHHRRFTIYLTGLDQIFKKFIEVRDSYLAKFQADLGVLGLKGDLSQKRSCVLFIDCQLIKKIPTGFSYN